MELIVLFFTKNSVHTDHSKKGGKENDGMYNQISVLAAGHVVHRPKQHIRRIPNSGIKRLFLYDTDGETHGGCRRKNIENRAKEYYRTGNISRNKEEYYPNLRFKFFSIVKKHHQRLNDCNKTNTRTRPTADKEIGKGGE